MEKTYSICVDLTLRTLDSDCSSPGDWDALCLSLWKLRVVFSLQTGLGHSSPFDDNLQQVNMALGNLSHLFTNCYHTYIKSMKKSFSGSIHSTESPIHIAIRIKL